VGKKIRFTISVDEDVHAAFVEMAETAGQSLSTAVGDWLCDTTESARFVSAKMRELRMSPSAAMLELAATQELAVRQTRELACRWAAQESKGGGGGAGARSAHGAATAPKPPCSHTGVNTPGKPGHDQPTPGKKP
jgi:hypothetical protein